jgi:outer membrane protein OmpA-like peptidoglycan-associated protein
MIDFSDLAASRSLAIAEAVGRLALRSSTALKPYSAQPLRRWAAVAALVAISGCSTFGGDVQKPSQAAAQASSNAAAKSAATTGSGEATADAAAGAAAGSATTSAAASASGASPDINSVPTTVPVPQDVSIDEVQPGLAADRTNAQYTDETLTAPEQNVARPAAPAPVAAAPATQPATQTAAVPAPAAPAAGIPAPQAPAVSQQPLAAPATGQYQAPQMAPSGQVFQGYTGSPQPGSKPFGGGTTTYQQQLGAVPQPTAPVMGGVVVDYSSVASGGTYGYASYAAFQRQNPAQAYYRSPYQPQPMGYAVQPGLAPQLVVQPGYQPLGFQPYGQPVAVPPLPPAGQPVGVVYFNNGSARLSGDDSRVVKQVADMHRYYGGVIRIVGHASQRTGNMDPYQQSQVNYEVSVDRAHSIARALTKAGVPASLVQVAAAGSANPVALETMPAGEANNRRVEIFLSAY